MAINYELINKGGISLGTNFELLSEKPLDSRLVVPSLDGLQNYIDNAAAYEGLIAYVSSEKKHYEVKVIDGVLSYRPFGLTEAELNDLITNATTAAMEFKGATATLPENPTKGDMYKIAGENISIKIDDVDAKLGDSIVYDGEKWFLIPSGDDIEDTWRPVEGVNNDAALKFVDGDKLTAAVAADGTIKYNHVAVAAPTDVTAEGDEKTRTYITAVETDGYGHITGYKTATENVEDTNTEYSFESQVESSSVYFNVTPNTEGATEQTVYVDAYSKNEANAEFAKKVDKVEGYSLVSDTEIARLANVDNYDDEEVRGLIGDNAKAIEDLEAYVGTIPTDEKYADITNVISYVNKKAEETLAAAQGGSSETAASVKQQLDNYKSENDTRVKAVEDDIDAINNADTGILKQAKDYADGLAGNYDESGAAAGVQTALEAEIAKKVDTTTYNADKATFAVAATVNAALDLKANAADVVANDTFESFKNTNAQAIADAKSGAVSEIEGKGYAVATEVAETYATKTELGNVDKKFADYVTSASYATDKANINKAIEDEAKARDDADKAFETRIAALEGNFGDGEGTVEAQIAAAVAVETKAREDAVKGVQDAVDAIEADYVKGADIADFETKENVKKVADDLAKYVTDNDAALAGVKATAEAARTEDEVNSQIDAKITTLDLGNTYELKGAEDRAKAYVDGKFTEANLTQYTTEQEVKDIVDSVIATAADSETYNSLSKLVDYIDAHGGEATTMAEAISALEDQVEVIEGKPAYDITATQVSNWDNEVGAKALAESKTTSAEVKTQIEAYGYATTGNVATAKQEAIDAAKLYADGLEHKDTTYTVAPTANALEFTVTPSEGAAQTVKLVAPAVNTGVMEVEAGNDIVVTPGENGKVTVAHETFATGAYEKNPAASDVTGDVYMMTSVTVENGHVTGANVQSLANALMGMTFILDGGNSSSN